MKILAPISLGELVDKITILEIKMERVKDSEKRHNIRVEHEELSLIYFPLQDRHLDNFHIGFNEIGGILATLHELPQLLDRVVIGRVSGRKAMIPIICVDAHSITACLDR